MTRRDTCELAAHDHSFIEMTSHDQMPRDQSGLTYILNPKP